MDKKIVAAGVGGAVLGAFGTIFLAMLYAAGIENPFSHDGKW